MQSFKIYGIWPQASKQASRHTHNFRKCSHTSVGLAQARPNYLGYVLLEQLSIATDIQFHVFNFQICLPWLFTKKAAHTMST